MTENEPNVAAEDVVETAVPVEEMAEKPVESPKKRNDVEYNWAEARRKMADLERQNREMQDRLKQVETPKQPEVDELDRLADDDILTKAQAKRLAEKVGRQVATEAIKAREAATVEDRLTSKFGDFNDVVSRENIDFLNRTEPELAAALRADPDPYNQGAAAYKMIKRLMAKDDSNSLEKRKAIENSQKPVSVQAITKSSAIGNAHLFENGLTEELKASLRKEMAEAVKRY